MALNIEGLASGLDVSKIIEGLLSVQQAQIDRLNARKALVVEQQTAFQGIESQLLGVQSRLSSLSRPGSNAFDRKMIATSDETIVAASVSSDAVAGTYSVTVNGVARNHQVASQVYEDIDSLIATGELTLTVGRGATTTITIGESNNTIEGLANSINNATDDITASVIKDSGGYKLLVSANRTGAANEIAVSMVPDDPGDTGIAVTFDMDNPVQAAADAQIQLGSGTGAIQYTSETNQVDELFRGVTLNLLKASAGQEVTLTVSRDVESASESVHDFVETYNKLVEFIEAQSQFDPESGASSALFGNRTLISIRNQMSAVLFRNAGLPAERPLRNLPQFGIRADSTGRLTINESRLREVLNGEFNGQRLSSEDISAVFGFSGTTSSDLIEFVTASSDTRVSSLESDGSGGTKLSEYTIRITSAARQAELTATNPIAPTISITDANNELGLELDRRSLPKDELTGNVQYLRLRNGDYTPEELADEIETVINTSGSYPGREIRVSVDNQKLVFRSVSFGTSSTIGFVVGSAAADLGFTGDEYSAGRDVAGEFEYNVDGETVIAEATGSGRILIGAQHNQGLTQEQRDELGPNWTHGIRLRVSLNESQVSTGSPYETTLTVSRGIAEELDSLIEGMLRNVTTEVGESTREELGQVETAKAEFRNRIAIFDESIERMNARFEAEQQRLAQQFTQLETRLADLQNLGSIISSQLGSLPRVG